MVTCLERGADLHVAKLMPLPLTVSCFGKIQIGFTFLVPAGPGSPGQRAVKRMCVWACLMLHTDTLSGAARGEEWGKLPPAPVGGRPKIMQYVCAFIVTELLRIARQIHCKAVEQTATLIHREYSRDWGTSYSKKGKVFLYSSPSAGPGADPGVQAVSPQVT